MVKIILKSNKEDKFVSDIRKELVNSIKKDSDLLFKNVYLSNDIFHLFIVMDKDTYDKLRSDKNSWTNKTILKYDLGVVYYNKPSIQVDLEKYYKK